ncbi:ABC transporter ATP-binding protein [Candidatus Lokiarchaeum ossiferum]|uniref:ABC transporter ATP-binding protein n=1 Tax=Candidatus Lokiarchaeum ossiferum TaxID=2951803 RepID=UPI00352CDDAE
METNNAKIVIDDSIKIYKRGSIEVVALRGLSCTFHKGEIAVIMGPSGCGKTTLLNMIGGLDRLNSGKIIVDGQDIAQFTDNEVEKYRRSKIGFVFQFMNLIPELNAVENITLPLELSGTLTKERKEFIQELLKIVGLEDRQNHRPDELSGGEQQRISIAAALANDPEIILCDEPTGELDSLSKKVVMDLLRSVIEKFPEKTMIIVSHDPELKAIADQMFYIRDGNISHTFTKSELQAKQQATLTPGDVQTYMPSNPDETNKAILTELRHIDHFVKDKINSIEKKMHPV